MKKEKELKVDDVSEEIVENNLNGSKFKETDNSFIGKVKRFFKFEERNTNFKKETIAGVITFLTMCYILMVNPAMLSDTGMPFGGVFLATALISAISCIAFGLFSNLPFALAPGMGTNAFFVYTVVASLGYTWQEALAAGILAGILFLIISVTPLRKSIIKAIPVNLRFAISAGIGFFIAFIGFKNAGIIESDPATFVKLSFLNTPAVWLALFGLILSFVLKAINFKYTVITSLLVTGLLGVILGTIFKDSGLPQITAKQFVETYKGLGDIKITASGFVEGFKSKSLWRWDLILVIISFTFVDMFDTLGTFMACGDKAGLIDENGNIENADKAMLVDAGATVVGNMLGTPVVTTYVESTSGIDAGAKTGFSSVVVGLLFFLSIAISPVFQIFGHEAVTSLALILVGISMATQLKKIEWEKIEVAIYSFITIIIMTLTFSIANGIAFGFIFYTIVMLAQRRFKDVHPIMYGLSGFFVIYYILRAVFKLG